jgi:hypothetical protein
MSRQSTSASSIVFAAHDDVIRALRRIARDQPPGVYRDNTARIVILGNSCSHCSGMPICGGREPQVRGKQRRKCEHQSDASNARRPADTVEELPEDRAADQPAFFRRMPNCFGFDRTTLSS